MERPRRYVWQYPDPVILHKCKGVKCETMTANLGGFCTKCLDKQERLLKALSQRNAETDADND